MRVTACLFFLFVFAANNVFADLITFELTTDKSTYDVGETVTWSTTITLSGVAGSNFGVHTVSFDLTEDQGLAMNLATIAAPFADYTVPNPGVAGAGTLSNVGAGQFGYDATKVEVTAASPGPTLLASGTFTAGVLGTHNLTLTPDAGQFFAVNSGFVGTNYTDTVGGGIVGDAVSFNVVPEASTLVLSLLGAATTLGCSLRRRAKANKKAKARPVDSSDSPRAV